MDSKIQSIVFAILSTIVTINAQLQCQLYGTTDVVCKADERDYILSKGVVSDSISYNTVTLRSCHLIDIEADAFENDFNLRHVDLSDNKISNLQPMVLDSSAQLIHLNLSYNWLQTLQPDLFTQKSNIEVLDLKGNQLSYLTEDIFVPLKKLTYLDMSSNELRGKELSPYIFDKNRIIKFIDLSGNDMTDSPENLLRSLVELDFLNLDKCSLKEFPRFATKLNLKTMRHLILSRNQITSIDRVRSLIGLENLEILDLSENLLDSIEANAFISLKKLNTINLRRNKLKTLPDGFFRNLAKLEVVDLSHNLLEYVPYSAFRGTALKTLDISSNNFSYMDANFCLLLRNYGVKINKVNFDENPWQCACLNDILIEMKTFDIEYMSDKYNGIHAVCVTTKIFRCKRQSLENQYYVNMFEDVINELSPINY